MKKYLYLLTFISTLSFGVDKTIVAPSGSLNLRGYTTAKMQTYSSGWQDRLTILNGGNVGIGTANPGYKLHISGTDTGNFISAFANTSYYGIKVTTAGTTTSHDLLRLDDNSGQVFGVYATGQTYIKGAVGIGTTSPTWPLSMGPNKYFGIERTTANSSSRSWGFRNDVSGYGDFQLRASNDNDTDLDTAIMTWLYNGNVGIGTTSPSTKLHVNGSIYAENSGLRGHISANNSSCPKALAVATGATLYQFNASRNYGSGNSVSYWVYLVLTNNEGDGITNTTLLSSYNTTGESWTFDVSGGNVRCASGPSGNGHITYVQNQ